MTVKSPQVEGGKFFLFLKKIHGESLPLTALTVVQVEVNQLNMMYNFCQTFKLQTSKFQSSSYNPFKQRLVWFYLVLL